jgi:DNA-binding NarL/FixJ family response regulator
MATHIEPARLSSLIGLIYDAAIDVERWPAAMEAIRLEIGCANAALALQRLPGGDMILHRTTNIPASYAERMPSYAADVVDQWGGPAAMMALSLDRPHLLSRVNPDVIDPARTTNRYSLDWALPQRLHDVVVVGLARDASALGSLAFGRHIDAGPFGDREEEILQLLIPHLQRAASITRLLELTASEHASLKATIDALNVAIVLVDGDLRILHANPAAVAATGRDEMIHDRGGILGLRDRVAQRSLNAAVRHVARVDDASGGEGIVIAVRAVESGSARGRGGVHGVIHAVALHKTASEPAPVTALFISEIAAQTRAGNEAIAALFELTPAETRVFDRLANGDMISQIATDLGIRTSTIKTHQANIYAKTGVHRRATLQKIASAFSVPVL